MASTVTLANGTVRVDSDFFSGPRYGRSDNRLTG